MQGTVSFFWFIIFMEVIAIGMLAFYFELRNLNEEEEKLTGRLNDLRGKKFGYLTPMFYTSKGKKTYWTCQCDCGNEHVVRSDVLISGSSKSCGCLKGSRPIFCPSCKNAIYEMNNKKGNTYLFECTNCNISFAIQFKEESG